MEQAILKVTTKLMFHVSTQASASKICSQVLYQITGLNQPVCHSQITTHKGKFLN